MNYLFKNAKVAVMIYSGEHTVEDQIVEMTASAGITLKSLHEKLENISLRAVYKAVHKLIRARVLIKVGKRVMIDQEWAGRVREQLGSTEAPRLTNGERAAYTFVSMEHLDAFWKTVILPIEQSSPVKEIFFYNPHNFWAYLPSRKESEDAYYQHFSGTGRNGFFTIGGNSKADMDFKRYYQDEHLQIDLRNIPGIRRTDHITVIGSSIITVRLAKGVADRIDSLYVSGRGIKDILPEIIELCRKPGKIRFVLEHNAVKAGKIKTLLAKNFYFRQSR